MTKIGIAGEDDRRPEMESSGGKKKTVVVGVKLDLQSRELLTWAMVKVAQPGDRLIAVHVLNNNEIVDHEGKSSLLSLVKAFDSILAVYEGFCNLKQVNLKLKICRGSSARKVLVREAKSYVATDIVVGTARGHTIRSNKSFAKYCAKKLPKDCSVLAADNGKVVFKREAFPPSLANAGIDTIDNVQYNLLCLIQRSSSVLNQTATNNLKRNCSICQHQQDSPLPEDQDSNGEINSMAMVAVESQQPDDQPSSFTTLIRELPDVTPGWPLLRRAIDQSISRDISVVQWAMQLPKRNFYENGAIVPLGLTEEFENINEKYSETCRLFTYEELKHSTSNFNDDNLIGRGGSSRVYRGFLPDGKEIAVKVLKPTEDAIREFMMEIEIITDLHHKNIISLLGFCFKDMKLVLVYDFLSRGSLEDNLHGDKKDSKAFGWRERYRVALGVAEALDYLHSAAAKPVIHRDVKSSNILLSNDFESKVSDFGLAKWASTSLSHITCTDVAGTFGYLAPEYFMYGKANNKIDVYAYGVVILELLSGRKPISNEHPKGQESLVMWAKRILNEGKISQLFDPNLGDNYNRDEMERMVLAAILCIRRSPRARPHMSIVLKLLEGDVETMNWARMQVNVLDGEYTMEDDEGFPCPDLQSHLNMALLDVEDDSLLSMSSIEQNISLEDYLNGRWSRSSSFFD
ncbi:protein kinase STUNTED [Impatiens glandulifera]|uniref:protein kinase STUNTED n=1 Tax=Impatiens glandulifera TaxID=253017 RepID=UPI001FB16872|nr:protein kinase STUNTED [Impatiens glandulifera]